MDGGFFFSAKLLAVPALFALGLTLVFAPLLLWLYRSRVAALMARGAATAWGHDAEVAPAAPPQWQLLDLAQGDGPVGPWQRLVRAARRRIALAEGAAGLAIGLVLTAAFARAFQANLSSGALWAGLIVFTLPAVATLLQLLIVPPLRRLLAFVAVLAIAWLAAGIGRNLGQTMFEAFVLLPALLLFVFSLPPWRAVAPLLLPLAAGASLLWVFGAELGRERAPALLWALRGAGFALGAGLGFGLLKALQARLESGRLGDQQLFVAAWWLVYVVYSAVVFTLMKRDLTYAALLFAFALWLLVRRLVLALLPPVPTPALSLLLLRVFDQGRRTERLFARLEHEWRLVGRIALIAGSDLARRSVGASDLVAFVTGRLRRRFVADAAMLRQRLAAQAARPDPDGRFGVDHYWCHADTWRPVMRALAARSDLVLMDLRGFDAQREGCAYELRHLAATAHDKPVLLIVSDEREIEALRTLLGAHEATAAPWRLARVGAQTTDLTRAVFGALPVPLAPRQA